MSDMGLSIAASGLAADSAELDAASNNLANISTPGYEAEQVNLSPEAASGPLFSGQGVLISSVSNLTDAVYSAANVAALGTQGAATQTNQVFTSLQSIFPEPSSSGIASQLTSLWSSISSLSLNPSQPGSQQAVVSAAQTLASTLSSDSNQLSQISSTLQSEVGSGANDGGTLAQANSLLSQIATMNVSIVAGDASGQNVNTLLDKVNENVNQLAGLLGVTSTTAANGSVSVSLNGVQLVAGNVAQTLSTTGSAGSTNLAVVTGNGVTVRAGGSIGANLVAVNSTVPSYQSQLNSVADSLASSLNSLQANGMSASGNPGSAIAGGWTGTVLPNIFVNNNSSTSYSSASPGFNSAASLAVSPALLADPSLLATASAPSASNSNVLGTATLDSTNAQAMAALASSGTGADATYQTLIGDLGTAAANAQSTSATATSLATTAANNVSTVSGVNQNTQEMNILSAQNAFQASSQVVSAIKSCLQSLLQAV